MNDKIKIAIFGGSGYGGSELLRILLFHPNAEIVLVTANEHAGKAIGEVHKNLSGLTDLRFEKSPKDLSALEKNGCRVFRSAARTGVETRATVAG